MKVRVLSRSADDYVRESVRDIRRIPRNIDPALHPFERPREYTRGESVGARDRAGAGAGTEHL